MTWFDHAEDALRRASFKPGGARSAVVHVLAEQLCCLPASEIHDRVRARRPGVGIASVYRALETLTALGLVHRIDLRSGGARYEPAEPSGDHHHHLVCGDCGRVEAFTDDRLERAIQTISQGASFRVHQHDVVLRGRCDDCA